MIDNCRIGTHLLDKCIKPNKVIGIHVPEAAVGQGHKWREKAGGDLFTDPGESREISHHQHPF